MLSSVSQKRVLPLESPQIAQPNLHTHSLSESESTTVLEQPNSLMPKEEDGFRDLSQLIRYLHQLTRFPHLVEPEQVALLSSELNEAIQREPCFQLEQYQVRILQVKRMLSEAAPLPGGEQFRLALRQHLIHAERAASVLFRDSVTPVQDSLWTLYQRILRLPTLEPDVFGAAVASLHEKLSNANSFDPLAEQLQSLLPELLPPAHYLWGQTEPYIDALKKLEEIKLKSLALVHRLRNVLEGYAKIFCLPMEGIFETYRSFLEEFDRVSDEKKRELCIPKAQLSGVGLGFFSINQEQARTLLCRNPQGKVVKENSLGTHAVHYKAGVFYKPNSDDSWACIRPEMEFAIYALYQLLGQQGVAPTCLAQISHLFLAGQSHPHKRALQAGYGIEGISLHDLLDVANVLPFLTKCLENDEPQEAFRWLFEEKWMGEFFNSRPDLSEEALSHLSVDESVTLILNAFEVLFAKRPPSKKCMEFSALFAPDARRGVFLEHIEKGHRGLLVNCVALLQRFPSLTVMSSNDKKRFNNGLRQVSCKELIDLQLSIKRLTKLFPNFSSEQLLIELPRLMKCFNSANFSTHFVVTLLTNPHDHRAENLMVTLTKNEQGNIHSFSLVGIDNDQAFAVSENLVRTMLYLLEPMNTPFDPLVAQRLLKMNPEGLVLDWLVALEEQNRRYRRWQKLEAVSQEDSFGKEQPSLYIPLEIDPRLIPSLYAKVKQLHQLLATSSPTHWEVLNQVQPELAGVYQLALRNSDSPVEAYDQIAPLFGNPQPPISGEEPPPVSLSEAAFQFLESLKLSSFNLEQQVSLIGKILRTFPALSHSLTFPGDPVHPSSRCDFFLMAVKQGHHALVACLLEEEKKARLGSKMEPLSLIEMRSQEEQTALLLACFRLDLEMVRLLIHFGADPQVCDWDGQTALSLCLMRLPTAPEQVAAVVRFLGDHTAVLFNAASSLSGLSPLHYLVEAASTAPEEAEPLIAYPIKKGAIPDFVDNSGKTPLDYAIEQGQERVVEQLIRLGAGRTLNVPSARAFFDPRPHLQDVFIVLQSQSLLLRWHLALDALHNAHSSKSNVILEGAQLGKIALPPGLTNRLLDKNGDINSVSVYGRHHVNKVTIPWKHDLFFKQYPEMPGVEYAINILFKLLIGHGTSFTDLARLTPPNGKSYPVLISQGIQGSNLQDVLADPVKTKQLEKLDPLAYSELLLASLLVNFEDAKPDNFIVEALPGGTYRLVGIDNDHAFVPALVKEGGTTVQVKCILYCMDQMKLPLHPLARERFLSFNPESFLRLWLNQLEVQNQHYCDQFSESERRELFKRREMVIPIPFKKGAIVDIYQKFRRLQIALQESPQLTGLEVLRLVIPPLGIRYEEAFFSYNNPQERFLSLTKTQYSVAIAGRCQTLVNSHQLLKSMTIPERAAWENAAEQGPTLALQELVSLKQEMHATGQVLCQIREDLQRGDIDAFNRCQLDISKEKVINGVPGAFDGIDFKAMLPDLELQKKVLSTILKGNYRSLRLSGCAVLDKAALNNLARHSPQLLSLELLDCSKIDEGFLVELSQLSYLTHLRLSDLSQLKQMSIPHPTLRRLEIVRCQGLQLLTISHTLKNLFIEGCWNLSSVVAKLYQTSRGHPKLQKNAPEDFILEQLHVKACPKLEPWWGMFNEWFKDSNENEIHLREVPPNPSSLQLGLVVKTILAHPEAKRMMASLKNRYKGEETEQLLSLVEDFHAKPAKTINIKKYWKELTDSGLALLSIGCSGLDKVDLSWCSRITDAGLAVLSKNYSQLVQLDLKACAWITDISVMAFSLANPGLTNVDLSGCWRITDSAILDLSKNCPHLTYVQLGGFYSYNALPIEITDASLLALSEHCPSLRFISLDNCQKITDVGLMALFEGCPSLDYYNLSRCHRISDKTVERLAWPNYRITLILIECSISAQCVKKMKSWGGVRHIQNTPDNNYYTH